MKRLLFNQGNEKLSLNEKNQEIHKNLLKVYYAALGTALFVAFIKDFINV